MCFNSLDGVATPFVLVDENDRVYGVLRLIPYPVPDVPERVAGMRLWAIEKLPGYGRTEADFVATHKAHSTVSHLDDRAVFSGAKVGRVAVDKSLRGTGMGRHLMCAAEEWLVRITSAMPDASGPCEVQLRLESQMSASKFYEQCVAADMNWL